VLSITGDHVPFILLVDVTGSVKGSPLHISAIGLKVGVDPVVTFTVIVSVVAHCPASGVNVYVVVRVLLATGAHVPVIPLSEVVGSVKASPGQISAIGVKTDVVPELKVTRITS
tara:strand:+ start:33 stop:374 length:342 start_codon:yes stop_codon:yes gene_type:complete